MTAIMGWIVRHPALSIALAFLITLGLGGGLKNLRFDTSTQGFMVPADPRVEFYEEAIETFGHDTTITVVIKSDDIFQEEILQTIENLTVEGGAIDGVSRVVSLTTVSNLKGEEGFLQTDDLLAYIPSDLEELVQVRRDALSNEILLGEVISRDGKTAAVHLFLGGRSDDPELEDRVLEEVEALLDTQRETLGNRVEMYQVGNPYMKQQIFKTSLSDLATLAPLGILAILVALLLFLRTFSAALVPALTGVFSVIAALGLMGYLDFQVNSVTSMIPILLVVIGCTEDIHLLAEYGQGLRSGMERNAAVKRMALKSGVAILLTSLTTFMGFITMARNSLPALSEFGIVASFGIFLNFVLTVLLVPSVLRFLPVPQALARTRTDALDWLRKFILSSTVDHRKTVVAVSILVLALAVVGTLLVVVDTDFLRLFREESEIRRLYRDVSENLVGAMPLLVVVDTGKPDGIKDPRMLANVAKISDFLNEKFDKAIGYADYIRKLHQEMNGGDPAFWKIPDNAEVISQYTLLLDPEEVERFVAFDFSRSAILVRGEPSGSRELESNLRDIEGFLATNVSKDLDVTVTGQAFLIYEAADTIARELIISIGWVFLAIFIFISLLFMSFKAGLLAMVPNFMPVLVTFGVMGWVGIPLSIATFPVAITALGIAVDDTIHFMVRFSKETQVSSDNREALTQTLVHELQPVLTTSFALILGFSIQLFGQWGSIRQFGLLGVVAMATAMVADLILTPALLETTPLISAWDLLKLKISDQVMAKSPLFRGLRRAEVKRVALLGELSRHAAGDYVLRQNEDGDHLVVLLRGEARVVVEGPVTKKTKELQTIGPGDVIGEMGFFTKEKRTANVIATEEVEALRIDGPRLERVQSRFPKVAAQIYYNLSQLLSSRLGSSTQKLFDLA